MKKLGISILTCALLCSGCRTTQVGPNSMGGLATGAAIGNTLGSAVGGLIGDNQSGWRGGYRGSALGSILGTVAGAAVGYAVTTPKREKQYNQPQTTGTTRGFETTEPSLPYSPAEELRIENVRFVDQNQDERIQAEETCKIIFEIVNTGAETAYQVIPTVKEVGRMKRIYISPSVMVEEITPKDGIRYTATVRVGKRIKTEEAIFRLAVTDETGREYDWLEFSIPTER